MFAGVFRSPAPTVRRRLAHAALATFAAAASACLLVYDPTSLAGPAKGGAGDGDAGCDGAAPGAGFCASLCPKPEFCDDFEGEGNDLPRWNGGGLGSSANRFIDNPENSIGVAERDGGNVLSAVVVSLNNGTSLGFVTHEARRPEEAGLPRGVRVRFDVRVPNLFFGDPDASPYDKHLYTFGLGDPITGLGIGLLFAETTPTVVHATIEQREIATGDSRDALAVLLETDHTAMASQALGFEAILAPASLLAELGYPCNLSSDDGGLLDAAAINQPPTALRALVRYGVSLRCVPLRDELADGRWLRRLQVGAGAALSTPGAATVEIDNVVVRFIP